MQDLPYANKSLGQHWLTDEASLRAMCDAVAVDSSDVVLEIGPGLGTLTTYLVKDAERVIAVEFDQKLAQELPKRIPATNLSIVSQDILRFDFTSLPSRYKVVANIPYYLTSNLIRVMSETPNPPLAAALLVQKEVAERVVARPGSMSVLSVTAQYYWRVSLGREVPAELFTPPPKVDSQILILERRLEPLYPDVPTSVYFRMVKAGYSQRRKTLLNSLSGGLAISREQAQQLCEAAQVSPQARAQTLPLDDWYRLSKQFNT